MCNSLKRQTFNSLLTMTWPSAKLIPTMSAAQGTTVRDRLLRLHLRDRSSAAPTVRRLPSAACAATLPFDVRSSGLFVAGPAAWNSFIPDRVLLTVFVVTWKLSFSRSTSVTQRIRGFAIMRYTNLLLTLTLTLVRRSQVELTLISCVGLKKKHRTNYLRFSVTWNVKMSWKD